MVELLFDVHNDLNDFDTNEEWIDVGNIWPECHRHPIKMRAAAGRDEGDFSFSFSAAQTIKGENSYSKSISPCSESFNLRLISVVATVKV